MKRVILTGALAGAMALTGCASLVSDRNYAVKIDSVPSGATVVVRNAEGQEFARQLTPATIVLPASVKHFSREKYTLEFSKDGYANATQAMPANLDEWFWANIPFGLVVPGMVIDGATGYMWELPKKVSQKLDTAAVAPAAVPAAAAEPVADQAAAAPAAAPAAAGP